MQVCPVVLVPQVVEDLEGEVVVWGGVGEGGGRSLGVEEGGDGGRGGRGRVGGGHWMSRSAPATALFSVYRRRCNVASSRSVEQKVEILSSPN